MYFGPAAARGPRWNRAQTPSTPPARAPKFTTRPDPGTDFVRSLPGVSVEDYRFTEHEDDERAVASLINPVLRNPIKLGGDDAHLVLGYAKTRDKKTGSTSIYKNEVVRSGNAFTLVVTAVPSGEIVVRQPFSPPAPHGLCDNEQKFTAFSPPGSANRARGKLAL